MLGFDVKKGSFGMLDSNPSTRSTAKLERFGELAVAGLASIGCLGAYVVALTVGLKAFMPLTAALVLSIGVLGALGLCFMILHRRYRGQASTTTPSVLSALRFRDRSGAVEEPELRDAA